jgi:hypothetical protein
MALSRNRLRDTGVLARTGSLIGLCTAVLTAAFIGVLALVSGETAGAVGRLPLYVLASAVVFVATLLASDGRGTDGITALVRAAVAGVGGFVLLALDVEGIIYAVTNPDAVVASHLFAYLLSAAIIASGLGYWSVRNWRDVSAAVSTGGLR